MLTLTWVTGEVNAAVVGVYNGTLVQTLNYFANIIHPIEELPPYTFEVYEIKHTPPPNADKTSHQYISNSIELESGRQSPKRRRPSTFRERTWIGSNPDRLPRIPSPIWSPLNILSIGSFILTIGLLILAAMTKDGIACVAIGTISLASSIVGYASWWSAELTNRNFKSEVPPGDVIIRTRKGAFILVRCDENVARELYSGTEECKYKVTKKQYRVLVAVGTFLLMISVVLLGNCRFTMQAAIGASYILLNGLFWGLSFFEDGSFWDLSGYECKLITPPDALDADKTQSDTVEGRPSFTRTLWYAIRETEKVGWVRRSGAAPSTSQWDDWLKAAEENARNGKRDWHAVEEKENILTKTDSIPHANGACHKDTAEQHAPALEVPLQSTK